jgi:hypothetical protein
MSHRRGNRVWPDDGRRSSPDASHSDATHRVKTVPVLAGNRARQIRVAAYTSGSWTARLAALLGSLIAFTVYVLSLAPTITQGYNTDDSGELASAAYTLGISHPTGSPLYAMLGYLVSHLTSAEPARALNAFSAVMGALAVGAAGYLICRLISDIWLDVSPSVPLLGAGLAGMPLALSTTFWTQAIVTETRTLAVALDVVVLLLVTPSRLNRARAVSAAAIFGLSLSVHLFSVVLAPAVVLLLVPWAGARFKRWLSIAGCLLLGLSCYLYLPIRAAMNPPANWGNPDTASRFFWVVTGREYAYQMLTLGPGELASHVGLQLQSIFSQLNVLTAAMALLGLAVLAIHRPRFATALSMTFTIDVLASSEYQADAAPVYLILGMACACIAAGVGWAALARQAFPIMVRLLSPSLRHLPGRLLPRQSRLNGAHEVSEMQRPDSGYLVPQFPSPAMIGSSIVLVLSLAAGTLAERSSALDAREAVTTLSGTNVRDFGVSALRALPPNAIIVGQGDENSVPLWYAQRALGVRKDVTIVANSLLSFGWYYRQVRSLHVFDPRLMPPSSASTDDGTDPSLIQERTALVAKAARPGYELFSVLPEPLWAGICTERPVGPVYRCVRNAMAPP